MIKKEEILLFSSGDVGVVLKDTLEDLWDGSVPVVIIKSKHLHRVGKRVNKAQYAIKGRYGSLNV